MTPTSQEIERQEYRQFLESLGARIRIMRKHRGWSYRDMVVHHGFHLSAWQGFETGKVGMALPSLLRVARTFGIHPSELIAGLPVDSLPKPEEIGRTGPKPRNQPNERLPKDEQS